jgi:hypothetical protein
VNFFSFFRPNEIRVSSIGAVSSLFPLRCRLSSDRCHYVTASCHASFPWSQNELAISASSSGNASSRRLPCRAEIEALNLHHRRCPPSLDRPTPTLHCYKNVISNLATLPTTQPRLHFASFLARAPRHRSSIRRLRSLSPLCLRAQRHIR